ncbi:MAG: prepilin-type N-terminal cleavage/methylation domain-containing protein [Gemmatimonadales bacterium]
MLARQDARGFTLIELLIVVVIIGLLVAIAIPKFTTTKEKAYLAAMKTDLRNLATAQEAYLYDNNQYTSSFPASVYTVSAGVANLVITLQTAGWQATIGHNITTKTCAIFVNAPAIAPATSEGVPGCTQ